MADDLQKLTPFQWTGKRLQAARLLADDRLTHNEIGRECGVTRQTLHKWRNHPDFLAKVDEFAREMEAAVIRKGIASRRRRVEALNKRWAALQQVIEERSEDESMANVPGGDTGHLVRQYKGLGSGDNFRVVEEYAVDTGLLRELREHEKQAAQELGQWKETHELTGKDGGPLRSEASVIILPEKEKEGGDGGGGGDVGETGESKGAAAQLPQEPG